GRGSPASPRRSDRARQVSTRRGTDMTSDIGFIGLGRMGGPMARNLAKAGHAVRVFDVDAGAMARLGTVGGILAHGSPRDVAANAAVLFTALPNDQIVQ